MIATEFEVRLKSEYLIKCSKFPFGQAFLYLFTLKTRYAPTLALCIRFLIGRMNSTAMSSDFMKLLSKKNLSCLIKNIANKLNRFIKQNILWS